MKNKHKNYSTPVFHIEKANNEQVKTMCIVFKTLLKSNVDFCVVMQNDNRIDELNIKSYGNIDYNEKAEILKEVIEMYIDGNEINHITME